MGCPFSGEEGRAAPRERWAYTFAIDDDLRFLSHRDMLRLFERALARASLPVRYSEGFNPHPRLSIPLPRPTGIASEAEVIVIEYEGAIDGDGALARLQSQMPQNLELASGRRLASDERLRPALVRYRLDPGEQRGADLESRIEHLRSTAIASVTRSDPKTGKTRSFDARAYLSDVRLVGEAVEFTLRVTPEGGVKPAEIAGLLGFQPETIYHRIRRLEVQWAKQNARSTNLP